ncbi:uncharacterized protein Z520_05199 [Fonsecaea multimorphosa CBS 102226]|uniref:D-xylose reductase [NAD(P)H] n=1 Tax=Fonsecaea multimorphosa CBS 102226 TaxID=1442371 RepID=A0A0D2KPS5_9EURO|nr:uncharacterized protein Z520_05199 [Fonsecaea multimorphosa CBS 102226]KIX98738.1 hypothetical protein Z520_05199 [Fonsecaea multimorphosa CBS 102226]OAL25022.1 hypothetical protein AYO22_04899 [Fonsecaea multimorphosa]
MPMESVKLRDENKIPVLAFGVGTAHQKNESGEVDRQLVEKIKTAISLGYYHLDGAEFYENERELGLAIKECGVSRENLYITTKASVKDNVGPDVVKAIEGSLERLGLTYVDQYLIHAPFWAKSDEELQTKWKDMETVYRSGKAKSIGISNYLLKHLKAVLETATVIPAVHQIEFHPYLQHQELVQYCRQKQIVLSAYAPLSAVVKAKPGPLDDLYSQLAQKYNVTEVEIALRWVMDLGMVAITTSSRETRLKQALKSLGFRLTPGEVEEISRRGLQKHYRGFWLEELGPDDPS